MNDRTMHPLEAILTRCAEAAPFPWYPSVFARDSGTPREQLDTHLDALRLGGLIRLTDWVQGHGQGYALTPAGQEVIGNPRLLQKLRSDGAPPPPKPAPPSARPRLGASHWDRGEAVRDALFSPAPPVVTSALIIINVLVFIGGLAIAIGQHRPVNMYLVGQDHEATDATGAVNIFQVIDGQWWRLLTACFVHIGGLHLAMNMFVLYRLGALVESLFGHWRYLLLYLIAGFGGSCAGVWFQIGCAGASGAICGLLGAFAIWVYRSRNFLPPELVSRLMRNVAINIVLLILISAAPRISWSGHLGGGVVGVVAALLLNLNMTNHGPIRWLALVGALLLPVACMGALSQAEYYNPWYRAVIERRAGHAEPTVDAEIKKFKLEVLPKFIEISKASRVEESKQRARGLIARSPRRRDDYQVDAAVLLLTKALAKLPDAVAVVRGAGPFNSGVERARLALLTFLEENIELLKLYRQCLESGRGWTDEQMARLRKQEEKERTAFSDCKPFLKKG